MVESTGLDLTQHLHGLKLCIPRKSKGILKKVQKKTQESVNQQAHTPKKLSTKAGSHNYTGSGVKAMHDADKETVKVKADIQNPFGELQWFKKN